MSVYNPDVFSGSVFDVEVVPVAATQTQGLLFDRRARAVPYRGPETGARVISPQEIRAARRRFRNTEDEWLLGVLTDAEWMEAA